jgi:anti-sigma-K factor RskA
MHPNGLVINDYVDDALDRGERADIERHLAACAECRALVDDLRHVRRRAGALDATPPPARAWKRIERALAAEQSAGRRPSADGTSRFRRWSWLAAAAVLVLSTIVGLRYYRAPARSGGAQTPAADVRGDAADAQSVQSNLQQAEQHYRQAIAGLEQIKNAERGALPPQTAASLEKSFSVVDQAINESREALKAQPNSEPAQESLLESLKTKIALLEDTVALINEMRKGNDAGAARIVSGLKQKGK